MPNLVRRQFTVVAVLFLAAATLATTGCSVPKGTIKERRGEIFDSPESALEQFKAAFRSEDPNQLVPIFGEEGRTIIISGDETADRAAMRRISRHLDSRAELISVQGQNFANEQWYKLRFGSMGFDMRIPLVNQGDGWYWATHHAADAAQQTRMAINELTTMHTLVDLVDAERQYFAKNSKYAQRIISSQGTKDGLYWPSENSGEPSPLDRLVSEALKDGYTIPGSGQRSYEGYYYRVLTGQGKNAHGGARSYLSDGGMTNGFAILATPKEWDRSGKNSYAIDMSGRMYKKDLGFKTASLAKSIKIHNPDSTWILVDRSYYGEDLKSPAWAPANN